jgi:hypothetical protein
MRATDFIRNILDVIDGLEAVAPENPLPEPHPYDDQEHRFVQIADLVQGGPSTCGNQPQAAYADIAAVTTDAGGGVNGPKNPADMRSNSISMYPDYQARKGS